MALKYKQKHIYLKTYVDLDTVGNAKQSVIMLKDLIVVHVKKQHGTFEYEHLSIYHYEFCKLGVCPEKKRSHFCF